MIQVNQNLMSKIISEAIIKVSENMALPEKTANQWIRAIEKASDALSDPNQLAFMDFDGEVLIIRSEKSNGLYAASNICDCPAGMRNQICYHKALARLLANYFRAVNTPTKPQEPKPKHNLEGAYIKQTSYSNEVINGIRI